MVRRLSQNPDKKQGKTKSLPRAALGVDPARLLAWYDRHARVLPWRALAGERPDPYHVWVSEIMLQQTTVTAVQPYFLKFLNSWPSVADLAAADLDDILRAWAGLGYYRRARMLHACAVEIMTVHGGVFPDTEEAWRQLSGVGPYTAAAIAAIAFDRRANVVDGNVERVVARVFKMLTPLPHLKPEVRARAADLLPTARYGDYAQALMDLGATVCTPRAPKCGQCPWKDGCAARAAGIAEELPLRIKPKTKPVRRAWAFVAYHPERKEIFIRKRADHGLLGGMMEVPSSSWGEGTLPELAEIVSASPFPRQAWKDLDLVVTHSFTHFDLELSLCLAADWRRSKSGVAVGGEAGVWVPLRTVEDEALPSVMRKIIRAFVQKGGVV